MTAQAEVGSQVRQHARWHWGEIAFWFLALSCAFLFPSRYLIMTDIVRLALFALSLDLILGYAGIVSLGHAAFFGVGAYSAGLMALHGVVPEPLLALVLAGLIAMTLGFATSFLVIRGADLTRLMVTLGIALLLEALAERFSNLTGGTDGLQGIEMQPLLGLFAFDMFGRVGVFLLPRRAVLSIPVGAADRALAVWPVAARHPKQPAARGGHRHSRQPAPGRHLYDSRVLRRNIRRAVHPEHGAGLARRVLVRTIRRSDAGRGDRRHRLSLRRLGRRRGVSNAAGGLLHHHAAILAILDRAGVGGDRASRSPAHAPMGVVGAEPGDPATRGSQGNRRR